MTQSYFSGASWVRKFDYLCSKEILVLTLKSSVRLRPRAPIHVSGCKMSHLLAESPRHIHFLCKTLVIDVHVMVNWRLSKKVSAHKCHMTVSRAQVYNSSRWRYWFSIDLGLKLKFSLLSASYKSWITWERHFLKITRELRFWPWLNLFIMKGKIKIPILTGSVLGGVDRAVA